MKKRYNYFYKITNLINGHYYYGVHSTNALDDGYMGSGLRMHKAYEKYGLENFKKEILKFFDTEKDMYEYEKTIVNEELVKDRNCYNIQQGGKTFNTSGLFCAKNKDGKCFLMSIDDEAYINGEISGNWKGLHHTKESRAKTRKSMAKPNSKNNRVWVSKNGITKYLLKSKLDLFLKDGWELGRIGYKPRKNAQGKPII